MAKKSISPAEVVSPRHSWTLITVLVDEGPGKPALALGRWDSEPVLAMRWNGTDELPLGNPQSRGLPTWFVIPPGKYTEAVLGTLRPDQLSLARNFLPKGKKNA